MSKNRILTAVEAAAIVAFSVWSMTVSDASAQTMHQHGGHSAHQQNAHAGHQHQGASPAGTRAAPAAQPSPHGGQISVAEPFRFEVVYQPRETHVYLYDASNRPISARGVQGQVTMKVRGYEKVYRYPLKFAAAGTGADTHDCLALALDVSRIKDGDMTATFALENLPDRQQSRTAFTQTFALSRAPLQVKVATPTQSVWTCSMHPQVKLAKQGKCPICGMGLIPLKNESSAGARHAASTQHGTAMANQITVSTATAADQAAIRAQRVCAVAGSRLGGMGTPVKVTISGKALFLCCKGCLAKVRKNPESYLAKAAQLSAGR